MTKSLSIIFCGTPGFAVPALKTLATNPAFKILAVVTQPDRPVGRQQTLLPSDVKSAALRLQLPVEQPAKLNAALADLKKRYGTPDFLVVVAYGQILSKSALEWPAIMPINVHGSLLPRWRGASPIEHAILAGDTETGITIQRMAEKLDAGDILAQQSIPVGPSDTSLGLRDRLSAVGADLLAKTLLEPLKSVPQDERLVTVCRTLSRDDGRIDPLTLTAVEIDRRLRAFTPWPGVTMSVDGTDVKILAAALTPSDDSVPLACKDGTVLHLQIVQPASKKPMAAGDWSRGRR